MEETNYTKRELDYFFNEVHKKLDGHGITLKEILKEAKSTNGKLRKHEVKIAIIWAVIGVMGVGISGIAFSVISKALFNV